MTLFDDQWIEGLVRADRVAERSDVCPRCRQPDHQCICNVRWLRPLRLVKNDDGPGDSSAQAA